MPIIINGGSYSAGDWWSNHLQKAETNERVEIVGFTNLSAETIPDAFREMKALAAGTKCENYFYQANINPRADEHLTPAQRDEAVELLEKNLGLTGQPRFVVEHQKEGRTHWHVVWSRIDTENMKAISDSLTAAIHERTSRALEIRFDLERGQSILVPNREQERPDRRPPKSETFRESGVDLETVKADARAAWERADNGQSFKAALEATGDYVLARGDRRDFVIIDRAGDDHSLGRRLGVKAAEVKARMADLDPAQLPSVAEAKEIQAERRQTRENEIQPTPDHAPPVHWDRDADESAWLNAVAQAAIEAAQAQDAPGKPKDGHDGAPGVKAPEGVARGVYAELPHEATVEELFADAAQKVGADRRPPEEPKPPTIEDFYASAARNVTTDWHPPPAEIAAAMAAIPDRAPKPEPELRGAAAEIRAAWALSGTISELEDALAARCISLAEVSREEAYASERHAALAREAGNFAPLYREGEIVAVDGRGHVVRLNERTTGDTQSDIEGRLAGLDRTALMNVADTAEAMRAASWAAEVSRRQAEREEKRPASAIETAIADALQSTMTGTDFAAEIDKKGITIARVTGDDLKMIEAVRAADLDAGTIDAAASGRRFADLMEGDYAAVTSQGNVFRLSPQKLDLEEIEQRLMDVQSSLPTVTRAYFAAQENRARIGEDQAARHAERLADMLERNDAYAGRQELRQATRAAETVVHAAFETPVAAASEVIGVAGGFLGGFAKIVAEIGDFLDGLFGGPKATRAQAEQQVKAATNEETLQADAYAAHVQAKETEFDERMHAQKTADQQQDLSFYQRYGAPPTREANLGREHDHERERERDM